MPRLSQFCTFRPYDRKNGDNCGRGKATTHNGYPKNNFEKENWICKKVQYLNIK